MPKLLYLLAIVCVCTNCRFSEIEVESDYSYSGKFNRYRTFAFVDNTAFNGESEEKGMIENNIKKVLQSWGYRYKENKSDILISYNFYVDNITMVGYQQPEFHSWVRSRFGEDMVLPLSQPDSLLEENIRRQDERYSSADMEFQEGTVYITFLERRREQSIWQGYASGVFGGDIDQNQRKMRAAIIRILDEFRIISSPS